MNLRVSIRKAYLKDAEAIARVHVNAWQQSYKDIMPEEYLRNISVLNRLEYRKRILSDSNPNQIHLVAAYGNEIIGFCDAGQSRDKDEKYCGEVYAIYLLDKFKGLGIGKKLWAGAQRYLIGKKFTPYIVWVLESNVVARQFYKKNGGKLFKEELIEIGGQTYNEVAYIFREEY